MIRPQRLRRVATAVPRSRTRTPSSGPECEWPLLKKRARPPTQDDTIHSGGTSLIASLKSRQPQAPTTALSPSPVPEPDPRVMLILHGLSPNLNASDFYRLAPSHLSSWQSVIKKVQQQRHPTTLEPLGRYHISFSTAAAAVSYRDHLLRLHSLAHHKIRCPGGLWESSAPTHLRSPTGEDPASELAAYTATSGTQRSVDSQRRRVSANKWAQRLSSAVKKFDLGDRPAAVLVHAYPPTLTAGALAKHIAGDALSRGCEWKVCPPQGLSQAMRPERAERAAGREHDTDTRDKLGGRFVVVCADDAEARRFHRHWNQRILTAGPGDPEAVTTSNVLHASIINW
ncbi:uncharacterized protein MAM_05178 [Metarhizium album ARSEF 1941]|uniref:Uncharacterized protein n=1 Tax=Metarhizium album (strain ARSEF 1941) TaxID=1081103 RepID=A0A0B2WTT6_METAS|nr:uncharacterized protein MAM_05178 [Metarhizium album ARSEF 1941]KHN97069.1 hypothetical protein MAM_05178 [Metarhizium album ARSEF 1941]